MKKVNYATTACIHIYEKLVCKRSRSRLKHQRSLNIRHAERFHTFQCDLLRQHQQTPINDDI